MICKLSIFNCNLLVDQRVKWPKSSILQKGFPLKKPSSYWATHWWLSFYTSLLAPPIRIPLGADFRSAPKLGRRWKSCRSVAGTGFPHGKWMKMAWWTLALVPADCPRAPGSWCLMRPAVPELEALGHVQTANWVCKPKLSVNLHKWWWWTPGANLDYGTPVKFEHEMFP